MPRIDLRDGQWADLRDRITHGTDKVIKKARAAAESDPDDRIELDTIVVRAFLKQWTVTDPDGNVIPVDDADAIDRAPEDIVDELMRAAVELYTGATVPNAPTPNSSDS